MFATDGQQIAWEISNQLLVWTGILFLTLPAWKRWIASSGRGSGDRSAPAERAFTATAACLAISLLAGFFSLLSVWGLATDWAYFSGEMSEDLAVERERGHAIDSWWLFKLQFISFGIAFAVAFSAICLWLVNSAMRTTQPESDTGQPAGRPEQSRSSTLAHTQSVEARKSHRRKPRGVPKKSSKKSISTKSKRTRSGALGRS